MPSIGEKELLKLKEEGWESPVLEARLAFAEVDTTLKYLHLMQGQDRVYPTMLPTQKSLRWSTKNPPLVNLSPECISPDCSRPKPHSAKGGECWSLRSVVKPDPGWVWVGFDWSAIEARLGAAFSHDETDLKMFNAGLDIHTYTACQLFDLPLPPSLKDPHHDPVCAEWRERVHWQGSYDGRRVSAKAAKYSLCYGTNERAILRAKGVEHSGKTKDELIEIGRRYLQSKPNLVAFKKRTWRQMLETRESRTFLGSRKRLFPAADEIVKFKKTGIPGPAAREGLNNLFQGSVALMMDLSLIKIQERWPGSWLVVNKHDGAEIAFREGTDYWPEIRTYVEQAHEIEGRQVKFPADFYVVHADGTKEEL